MTDTERETPPRRWLAGNLAWSRRLDQYRDPNRGRGCSSLVTATRPARRGTPNATRPRRVTAAGSTRRRRHERRRCRSRVAR